MVLWLLLLLRLFFLHAKYRSIIDRVKEGLEKEEYKRFIPLATELDDDFNLVDVAASLMNMLYEKEISYDYTENSISAAGSQQVRLFLTIGRMDKLNPKMLLDFLVETAAIGKEEVGNIDILEKFTFIDVSEKAAEAILKNSSGKKFGGRKLKVEMSNKRK